MKNSKQALRAFGALIVPALFVHSPGSQAQAQLMVDVGPCVLLETAVERYSCYEQQVNGALNGNLGASPQPRPRPQPQPRSQAGTAPDAARAQEQRSAPVVSTPAPAAPAAAGTAPSSFEESFGLPKEEDQSPDQKNELLGTIGALKQLLPNQYLITLENGQIWRQVRPDSRFRMKEGQHVRIYPTSWGDDYRMSVEELNGFIQVQRVK